jgi:hypothetical protein
MNLLFPPKTKCLNFCKRLKWTGIDLGAYSRVEDRDVIS